jgi:hypothetical protein
MNQQETPKPNRQLREIFSHYGLGTKTLILGMSECGKSYLGRLCVANYPRVLIVDIMGEYQGFDTVKNIPALVAKLKANANKSHFTIVYQFSLSEKNKIERFDEICQLVFYFKNIHLSIEEVDKYCSPHNMPEWFENLLRRGRHHNISVTMSTQAPCNLNKMCVKQANDIFIGMLKEVNDVNYATNLMMGKRDELLKLKSREFLHEHKREIIAISTNSDTTEK